MNTDLFNTKSTDTTNEAGGAAYALPPKHELVQYAVTGTFSDNCYTAASDQLARLSELAKQLPSEFIAKTAVYARESGHMKDTPAVLMAILTSSSCEDSNALVKNSFSRVIDNGRMVRNYAQAVRSGVFGRKSFGNASKRQVQNFLRGRSPQQLLRDSVGKKPSIADVINMVHPRPADSAQEAMFGYLVGKPFNMEALPQQVQSYIRWKNGEAVPFEDVSWAPFELLTSKKLSAKDWADILRGAGWHMTRMNINTAIRQNVFTEFPEMVNTIAEKLCDPDAIKNQRVFPYQVFTTYLAVEDEAPRMIKDSLETAVEISLANIPEVDGNIAVLVDTSGSMNSPVTGYRRGASSKTTCVDAASLVAAGFRRKMGDKCTIVPFDTKAHSFPAMDASVLTVAHALREFGGGGTDCSCALRELNKNRHMGNLVVFVSDNESWVTPDNENRRRVGWGSERSTSVMDEWNVYKRRNPGARLVCIDIQPYGSTQAHDREDILNIGGFSDSVFETIAKFAAGELDGVSDGDQSVERFVAEVEAVEL